MSYFIHRDHLFWPLLIPLPADRLVVALKSIFCQIPNHSWFCSFLCNSFNVRLNRISILFIRWSKIIQWGLSEGSLRVRRGKPQWTLNQPSMNPHSTLSQQRIGDCSKKCVFLRFYFEKKLQLHVIFRPIVNLSEISFYWTCS